METITRNKSHVEGSQLDQGGLQFGNNNIIDMGSSVWTPGASMVQKKFFKFEDAIKKTVNKRLILFNSLLGLVGVILTSLYCLSLSYVHENTKDHFVVLNNIMTAYTKLSYNSDHFFSFVKKHQLLSSGVYKIDR